MSSCQVLKLMYFAVYPIEFPEILSWVPLYLGLYELPNMCFDASCF